MFHRLFGDRHQSAADAGIGPDRIQPAVAGNRFVDVSDDVLFGTGVRNDRFRRAARFAHLIDRVFHALGAIDRDQFRAFLREQQRRRTPDAAAGAGNDDGFAFEAAHGVSLSVDYRSVFALRNFSNRV